MQIISETDFSSKEKLDLLKVEIKSSKTKLSELFSVVVSLFSMFFSSTDIVKALNSVQNFVIEICKDRKPSHNDQHMRNVKNTALFLIFTYLIFYSILIAIPLNYIIYQAFSRGLFTMFPWIYVIIHFIIKFNQYCKPNSLIFLIEVVAWMHDVADHKYVEEDPTLTEKMDKFLDTFTNDFYNKRIVKDTIYENLFTSFKIKYMIECISFSKQKEKGDADWFRVLGYFGIYIRNIVSDADKLEALGTKGIQRCFDYIKEKNNEMTNKIVYLHVEQHYHEKLKHLATTKYMKTYVGLIYAKFLRWQMRRDLDKKLGITNNTFIFDHETNKILSKMIS
jgi:hypothetical protein